MSSTVSLNASYSGSATDSTVSTTTSTSTSMADTFLTLLVAEIQNQDPTDPTDPTEYVTQLSSMAQVAMAEEVATEMNTNAILMSNLQVMALGKMVGDPIMVQTTTLEVDDGAIQGRIDLDDACTRVDIHITDEAGNDYDIPLTGSSFGPGAVSFSIDPADYGIPPGDYSVSVVTDTGEEEVPVEVAGVVTDVRIPLDGGTPLLNVSGVGEVPFTMISQFGVPDDAPAQDIV
ncbi:flagellar hook capping FlgD N-terminal domain-containing protein [Pseudescherichia sp.]|uniref:flagellar hook capping FlgD N-terminal domain-containing protein n=1 Tax=Pseudescherichia sp. TaxID=2055881 RepID=UPI002899A255|nr:flagellar hook capping FlgD N-terminal domain-containing protein [Pseudescherichia sp.]